MYSLNVDFDNPEIIDKSGYWFEYLKLKFYQFSKNYSNPLNQRFFA